MRDIFLPIMHLGGVARIIEKITNSKKTVKIIKKSAKYAPWFAVAIIAFLTFNHKECRLLLIACWIGLGVWAWRRVFRALPEDNPFREAMAMMVIPVLLFMATWHEMIEKFSDFFSYPTIKTTIALLGSKPFLTLVLIYFATVCYYFHETKKRTGGK